MTECVLHTKIDECKPRSDLVKRWLGLWRQCQRHQEDSDGFRFVVFVANPCLELLECMLGCMGAGLVVVPLNWRWSLKDMCHALVDMQDAIVGIVVDEHFEQVGESLLSSICDGNGIAEYVKLSAAPKAMQPLVTLSKAPHDVACIIFTSGTASKPKAAMLTHDNIIFQCYQKVACCGYRESDVYLHMAPLFHVGGLVSALAMTTAGARHVFMPSPQFDACVALELIREHSCTSFIAVPTMLRDMLDTNDRCCQGRALDTVQRVLIGAGGLDESDAVRAQRMIPHATLLTAYGMTEACSSMSYNVIRSGQPADGGGSMEHVYVGEIPDGIHLGIANSHGYVHHEGKGEIVTRGRHVFYSYYTGKTTGKILPDFLCDACGNTWFRTGDLGLIADGNKLWLSGRLKDVIKSGGENVAAAEVERTLMKHPDIVECSVYAIPDARWGEAVAAAVVCGSATIPNGRLLVTPSLHGTVYQRIKAHCMQCSLSPFKIPKYIMLCSTALPRNATGKVVKHALQKATMDVMARDSHSKL